MTPNVITSVLAPAKPQFRGGAARDLCSLESVQEDLQLGTDRAQDKWLRERIADESENIENYCNRIFQEQWYQDHFWPFRDSQPRKFEADLLPLQLAHWPVCEAVSMAGIAPPRRPMLISVPGGTLAGGRYFVRCTYVTAEGETAASLEANISVASGNLVSVMPPEQDVADHAIGWNCYIGLQANCETLQNADPLSLSDIFTVSAQGLSAGRALPPYVLVVEEGVRAPNGTVRERPMAEGVDFLVDHKEGQLIRVHHQSRHARSFSTVPLIIQYRGGFAEIPRPVRLSAIELVKFRWFARKRDPGVRSENVEGVYQADYWFGTGPSGPADMPSAVADRLERYRVPVIA